MATIVIDPGHYEGYNAGVCPGYFEGNAMLKLAQYLGAELTKMGANVKYTRTTNEQNPSLQQRGQMGANSDLFISLHSDASNIPGASGVTSFYSVRQPQTEPFAAEIGKAAANAMGISFRGTFARESQTTPGYDYLGVIRAAVAAGAKNAFLIEHGFHSTMKECQLLSSDTELQKIAAAEAAAIAKHFNLSGVPPTPTGPTTPPNPGGCRFNYTVKPGESLYSIGQKFGIPWQTIATENNLTAPYALMAGEVVIIPASGNASSYTVRSGDSLYSIGEQFGVPWQAIAIANNIASPYRLYLDQQLLIPDTCYIHYTVQSGDSLYTIGTQFGIPWEKIAAANQLFYPYVVTIGQNLMVPLYMKYV